jgi:Fur family ferric uptake transcriptional regulator
MANPITLLQKTNHRITKSRRNILSVLTPFPLRAYDVQKVLHEHNQSSDLVTIYRTLELFVRLGLVAKTTFGDGAARYEISS